MASSKISCNVPRIIASLSGRVETMIRNIETMKRHNETTKWHNDDEPGWSVMSRTGKKTNQTDKMTRRTHEASSNLLIFLQPMLLMS